MPLMLSGILLSPKTEHYSGHFMQNTVIIGICSKKPGSKPKLPSRKGSDGHFFDDIVEKSASEPYRDGSFGFENSINGILFEHIV